MYNALIWAGVVIYFLVRAELAFKAWLRHQEPLQLQHYNKLVARLDDLQNQLNGLAVRKEYD